MFIPLVQSSYVLAIGTSIFCFPILAKGARDRISQNHAQIVFQVPENKSKPKVLFESPEHQAVTNLVNLRYSNYTVSGSKFSYPTKSGNLSYGDIVSLAGDYYFHWTLYGSCAPSISKTWDRDPEAGIDTALDNSRLLQDDVGDFQRCVLEIIQEADDDLMEGLRMGQDPAQVIDRRASSDNVRFTKCTNGGYAFIALCNYDHFGNDALKAYIATHTAALRQAIVAYNSTNEEDLRQAYFLEGYAQHWLTDIFSSGHLRVPRRTLHSRAFTRNLYPGDRCSQKQHDEDSAIGLWVTNALGESWAAYGDKTFLQGRSAKNMEHTLDACQLGLDEIWEAFTTGQMPQDYRALQKVPLRENTFGITNFVPLFHLHHNATYMHFRQSLDDRAGLQTTIKINTTQNNSGWVELRDMIANSGAAQNLYVFTKAFSSDSRYLHFGMADDEAVVTNVYGNVDAGKFGTFWSMQSQSLTTMPQNVTWTSVEPLGGDIVSFVGRMPLNNGETGALHLGIKVENGIAGALWENLIDDGRSMLEPGRVLYGTFDTNFLDKVMVKTFIGDGPFQTELEVWGITIENPVERIVVHKNLPKIDFLLPHKFHPQDPASTLVGYGQEGTDAVWTFMQWSDSYSAVYHVTFGEKNISRTLNILSDPIRGHIIRIHTLHNSTLEIDVLHPYYNESTHTISFVEPQRTMSFPINWNATSQDDYLLWFLHDVNNNGISDLVAYVNTKNNTELTVLVFPGSEKGSFGVPVVSSITLEKWIGHSLTAEFLNPIHASQATYRFPASGDISTGAIVEFFDNYGVIGMRLLAPRDMTRGYKYELKGQNPAIAGQRSVVLGEQKRSNKSTKRRRAGGIGVIPLK